MITPEDAATMRTRARVGLVLKDKWRIESLLGVGGMAVVYVATHTNNGRRVAIKMLHPELSMNAEIRARFLREGYVANKIAHPGAVAILDDDVAEDGSVFLVMELLEGETIETRRIRKGGTLEPTEILSICDQVLAVLAAAHEKGIVHRDVKPDNVFLTKDGGVKLLDFGIARIRELTQANATVTGSGAMGTPAFMPPEQARGRWDAVGPRTDVWAMGATMFTLATGNCVHEAETLNEVLLAAMTKPAPALATAARGMPPPFCALIDRALAYEISQRWSDAAAMQIALRQAYQDISLLGDGPSTNRGIGKQAAPNPNVPPAALTTGPRPPPEFTPPPFKISDAVREAANRLPPQNDPSTTSGVVLPSTASGSFAGPSHAHAPTLQAAGAMPAPVIASHPTANAVTFGTGRPSRHRGLGIAAIAAGALTMAAILGVYSYFESRSDPPSADRATSATAIAAAASPPPAIATAPVAAPTGEPAPPASAAPTGEPAPPASAAPSVAPEDVKSAGSAKVAPALAPKTPAVRPSPSPSAAAAAAAAKRERDLLNRRN